MRKVTSKSSWAHTIRGFKTYILYERGLSQCTADCYIPDINKLYKYLRLTTPLIQPIDITYNILSGFVISVAANMKPSSQCRLISSIKAFYKYLLMTDVIDTTPADLLELPKKPSRLPKILSLKEINSIINVIKKNTPVGKRNRCIIEVLYACGLRVSELINLKISNIHFKEQYIKVTGKGNRERLVPISTTALRAIEIYMKVRKKAAKGHEDTLFISIGPSVGTKKGKLTRTSIFYLVRRAANKVGLIDRVYPHIFRHSFASHLIQGGAGILDVGNMMGHMDVTTTEQYIQLDQTYLSDLIKKFHPRYQK